MKGIIDLTVLGIDTSGKTASVSLVRDDEVLAQTTVLTKLTHSQVILPLCKDMLKSSETPLSDVDVIAVSDGPGSYTGLRIGISTVKAMCFALKKPCVGVSVLESLAYNFLGITCTVCVVMSARQNLVYNAFFNSDGEKIIRITEDRIVSEEDLFEEFKKYDYIIVTGDYSKEFCVKYSCEKIKLSPPHLRLQLASSLCLCAMTKEPYSPEKLNASYLQPTQAEKIRLGSK